MSSASDSLQSLAYEADAQALVDVDVYLSIIGNHHEVQAAF